MQKMINISHGRGYLWRNTKRILWAVMLGCYFLIIDDRLVCNRSL